ncbi:MAG: diguanylate cyclase [Candidatus Aminicenantales bacterium]
MRIRTKFFIVLTPLLGVICLLIFIFAPTRFKKQTLDNLALRAKSITEMTSFSLSPALFFNDIDTINEVFLSARQNKDLVYIVVLDPAGKTVSSFNEERADRENYKRTENNSISPDGTIFRAKAPILYRERKLGELHIGLSLKDIQQEMNELRKEIWLISIFIFCIGTIVIFVLSTLITRPLRRMTRTTRQIADGDLSRRTDVSTRDEAGQLARSFNVMVDHLQSSYSQLENAKLSLEKRVEERTRELQNEVAGHKRTEEALQEAYEKLRLTVQQLEQRHRDMALLSELGDSIQTCTTEEEIFGLSSQYAKKMFPNNSGILYVHKNIKELLEAVMSWGEALPGNIFLEPDDCWALRRGKIHSVHSQEFEQICPHAYTGNRPFQSYLCIPLSAHGETMGLFHLRCPMSTETGRQSLDEKEKQEACRILEQLALTFAERVAMALADLRLRETLRQQSIHDPLTGLFNRRFMEETLEKEIYRSLRSGASLGVIMLDIDLFKQFNETFGHDAGDIMLKTLGQFLQGNVRREDVACRYGGEEFTLILPGASLPAARERAEFLLKEVQKLNIQYSNVNLGPITLSFGVSIFPEHGQSAAALLKAADTALLRAKKEGRCRVVVSGS